MMMKIALKFTTNISDKMKKRNEEEWVNNNNTKQYTITTWHISDKPLPLLLSIFSE